MTALKAQDVAVLNVRGHSLSIFTSIFPSQQLLTALPSTKHVSRFPQPTIYENVEGQLLRWPTVVMDLADGFKCYMSTVKEIALTFANIPRS